MSGNKNKSSNKKQIPVRSAAAGSPVTTTVNGKKRKVWARTADLSCGNSAVHNASTAVENTSSDSGRHNGGNRNTGSTTNTSDSADKRSMSRGATEVKISFGPSRPPTSSSNGGAKDKKNSSNKSNIHQRAPFFPPSPAAAAASMTAMLGDIDLETLKEKAAAAAAGHKSFRNKHGLPCTEAEMKALMSMFVEIMGMSMSTNNKEGGSGKDSGAGNMMYRFSDDDDFDSNPGSPHRNGSGPIFSFGANPMDASSLAAMAAAASGSSPGMMPDHMAAATAGFFADEASWEALRRTYAAAEQIEAVENDDEDDESFENRELTFEELEFLLHHRKQKEEAEKLASQFASGDWESLEQVAISDHLLSEADDKERKAAKKREKKQRRKAKLKEEAAQKAAEAAQKKREKAIISWRSRVVSACQSNETTKLDGLLQESPLRKLMEEDNNNNQNDLTSENNISTASIISHLEFLLPNSVAKNRSQVERGIEARLKLADYILHTELLLAFKPLRTGRTALHTACFHGDLRFLELLFSKIESYEPTEAEDPLPASFLNLTCDESGWSPLHYASLSGSSEIMELLLSKGSYLSIQTDVTHTWRESDGRGLTPRELVQCVQCGNYEEVVETHGLALQEMTNVFFNHHQERRIFMKKLDLVHQRLCNVEKDGYTPLSKDRTENGIDAELQTEESMQERPDASSSRNKKKKKKKKKKQNGKDAESRTVSKAEMNHTNSTPEELNSIDSKEEKDPLIAALLGMGFNEEQIMAAVKACGGTHRATADDLVTWILGRGENEESFVEPQSFAESAEKKKQIRDETISLQKDDLLEVKEPGSNERQMEEELRKEETARRLAAKREEARRRNREWNNREQARQEMKAKAKVTQKIYSGSRAAVPVTVPTSRSDAPSKGNSRPCIPNGIRSSHMTRHAIPGIKPSTRQTQSGNKWGVPPTSSQTQSYPRPSGQSNVAPHLSNSTAPTQVTTNEQQSLPVSSFFTSTNDDDKTVSSFGSSRGVSVSSKELVPLVSHASVPPPGFTPSVTQPTASRPPVSAGPENPSSVPFSERPRQGEIRATAKEFVPSFAMLDSRNSDETFQKEPVVPNDRSTVQSSQSYDLGFPPGILQQQSAFIGTRNSLLGSSLQNSFDNSSSITPPSMESIVPSTSFITGSKMKEPTMTIPFGIGQGDSNESNGTNATSRLLNSISKNTSIGSSSIWGDSQNITSLESTLHSSFFRDGKGGDGKGNGVRDEKTTSSWDIPTSGHSILPNNNGQGSIW